MDFLGAIGDGFSAVGSALGDVGGAVVDAGGALLGTVGGGLGLGGGGSSLLNPLNILPAIGSALGLNSGDTASASQSTGDSGLDLAGYSDRIAAAQDNYTNTMRQLTEQSITENKKFAVTQLADTRINKAAMDDYRVAENFVLNNIQNGYIAEETRMGVPSAAIPMPYVSGQAVAANAPHVQKPEMFNGDPDPLAARKDHMDRMDQIMTQVESGNELSETDKDYLAGLRPPVDWRDANAIHHAADQAHQAYDAFANARTPEADPEAFQAWLDEVGQTNGELSQQVMDAYQSKETLDDIKSYAMAHPFGTVAESVDGFTMPDPEDPQQTISGTDYLTRLGYDPSTMTLVDLNAAVEQADTDFTDAQTALNDYVDNSQYTGPASQTGSQSVSTMGTSSIDGSHNNDAEWNSAANILADLV